MKRFVPLFEEFDNADSVRKIVVHLAHAIEETGKFGFIQVRPDNSIVITDDHNFSDFDTYYIHDEDVRIYGEYKCVLKPVFADDTEMARLVELGLAQVTDVIQKFTYGTSLELDSKDKPDFSYTVGDTTEIDDQDFLLWQDMGVEPNMTIDSIASEMADWIKESWNEYAYGLDVQSILDEKYPEYEEDDEDYEDDDEEIDESASHESSVQEFVEWACGQLGIQQCPDIEIGDDHELAVEMKSMAYFHPGEYRIFVLRGNRLKADWYRSLAHELTHAAQFERGEDLDGSTGSPHENEANSMAGQMLRDWGKIDQSIYIS